MKKLALLFIWLPYVLVAQEPDTTEYKSSFALFPALSYAPETSVQFGAVAIWVLKNKQTTSSSFKRENTVSPYFLYTFRNQVISAINVNYFTNSGGNINGTMRYLNFPDFYFGIGNDNDPDISERYTNAFMQVEGQYFRSLNTTSFLGVAYDLQYNSIKDVLGGGLLETDNVNGIKGGGLIGMGPAYRYDSRDHTIYPTKGYFISYRSIFTYLGDFNYASHVIDARKYVQLGNEKHVLAMQIRSNLTSGRDIPFYKLSQLGGDERLRGIANASLYRDRQMVFSQVEYRRPLFWRLGMTVFAGIGDVANDLGDFNLAEFKYVAGIGGRFAAIPDKKLNIRGDIGIARGGQMAIYIGLSEAF